MTIDGRMEVDIYAAENVLKINRRRRVLRLVTRQFVDVCCAGHVAKESRFTCLAVSLIDESLTHGDG